MKVNLLNNDPKGFRQGYLNIDPARRPEHEDGRVACPHDDLDAAVDDNECDEIVAHLILDLFPAEKADPVLDHWLSKLAHGGVLHISFVDLRAVARSLVNGAVDAEQANALLHSGRQCSLTAARVRAVLESKGLRVLKCKLDGHLGLVSAERA